MEPDAQVFDDEAKADAPGLGVLEKAMGAYRSAGAHRALKIPWVMACRNRWSPHNTRMYFTDTFRRTICSSIVVWDGWHIAHYLPQGELIQRIRLPVSRPTRCCCRGASLDPLYATSALVRLDAQALAASPSGALFALEMPSVRGLPQPSFASGGRFSRCRHAKP